MKKGLFEYTVMLFALTNTSASFQEMMDEIFKDVEGVVCCLDDILIYGRLTEAEYQQVVEQVLQKLLYYSHAINLEKSVFHVHEVDSLGHVINGTEIKMQQERMDAIQGWLVPSKKKQVQAFLGFANYYYSFILNYSAKVKMLTELTKDVPISWGTQQ